MAAMHEFNSYIRHIDTDSLGDLCVRCGRMVTLEKNEYLFREGEVFPFIGFVGKGILKYVCVNKSENRSYNTGFAFAGEFAANYPACIYGLNSETGIQALTQCELYLCPVETLLSFYEERPDMPRTNAEQLFLQTYSRYLDLYRLTSEERYLQLLERCPEILQLVPLKEIASYLKITPTHMSRIRRKQSFG